jgi:Amt family ammonium transporter
VGALVLGKRLGLRSPTVLPHNVPFAILGMGLLWFGWLGFNGGSALAAGGLASSAFVNTFFAPAAAAAAWGLAELLMYGKMSGVGLASGAVAGMVAITPAAGFVAPVSGLVIGAVAAMASFTAIRLRPKLGLDDSLDVFAVHGVAATLGALLTGVFASTAVNPGGADGSLALLGKQAVGVVATLLFSGGVSLLLYKLVAIVTPLRAGDQEEWTGLDESETGERAYLSGDADFAGAGGAASPTGAPSHLHAAAK